MGGEQGKALLDQTCFSGLKQKDDTRRLDWEFKDKKLKASQLYNKPVRHLQVHCKREQLALQQTQVENLMICRQIVRVNYSSKQHFVSRLQPAFPLFHRSYLSWSAPPTPIHLSGECTEIMIAALCILLLHTRICGSMSG